MANGTVITSKGFKWYPSGVVTTPNDEVLPLKAPSINQFIFLFQDDDTFKNSELNQALLPEGYSVREDGALVSPIGLIAYPNGYVVTSDGFVTSLKKQTFS